MQCSPTNRKDGWMNGVVNGVGGATSRHIHNAISNHLTPYYQFKNKKVNFWTDTLLPFDNEKNQKFNFKREYDSGNSFNFISKSSEPHFWMCFRVKINLSPSMMLVHSTKWCCWAKLTPKCLEEFYIYEVKRRRRVPNIIFIQWMKPIWQIRLKIGWKWYFCEVVLSR